MKNLESKFRKDKSLNARKRRSSKKRILTASKPPKR
jgi:hypothetical protein